MLPGLESHIVHILAGGRSADFFSVPQFPHQSNVDNARPTGGCNEDDTCEVLRSVLAQLVTNKYWEDEQPFAVPAIYLGYLLCAMNHAG